MITKIKNRLKNDEDKILEILEKLNLTKIKLIKDKFVFGINEDSTGKANVLYVETLSYKSYSRSISGDIITLVSFVRNCSLGDSIRWLSKELNIAWQKYEEKNVKLPFGGFWKTLDKDNVANFSPLKTYSEDIVKYYQSNGLSLYWVRDGISLITQEYFNIGYDVITGRNTIIWRNEIGECIGIQGRLDKEILEDWESKYLPVIRFDKGGALYGLYENYKDIQEKEQVIIVESEKSVLKAHEIGYKNVCAIGCSNISYRQEMLIKSLAVDVVIAFDEGLELADVIAQAKKSKIKTPFWENNVYVLDMSGFESKCSIFDLEKEVVVDAFENRCIYI